MSTLIKMASVLIVLNMFMYIGLNFAIADGQYMNNELKFRWEGDIFDLFFADRLDLDEMTANLRENYTTFSPELDPSFTEIPQATGGENIGDGGISFLDLGRAAFAIIPTLFNLAAAPLTLFFNFHVPTLVGLMIGVPYTIIFVLTLFAFIRGVSD